MTAEGLFRAGILYKVVGLGFENGFYERQRQEDCWPNRQTKIWEGKDELLIEEVKRETDKKNKKNW